MENFDNFDNRIEENLNRKVLKKATAFDPRFKSLKCLGEKEERESVWEDIVEELYNMAPVAPGQSTIAPPSKKIRWIYSPAIRQS